MSNDFLDVRIKTCVQCPKNIQPSFITIHTTTYTTTTTTSIKAHMCGIGYCTKCSKFSPKIQFLEIALFASKSVKTTYFFKDLLTHLPLLAFCTIFLIFYITVSNILLVPSSCKTMTPTKLWRRSALLRTWSHRECTSNFTVENLKSLSWFKMKIKTLIFPKIDLLSEIQDWISPNIIPSGHCSYRMLLTKQFHHHTSRHFFPINPKEMMTKASSMGKEFEQCLRDRDTFSTLLLKNWYWHH